jgi:hypothetical protein
MGGEVVNEIKDTGAPLVAMAAAIVAMLILLLV